jgi:outer membrane protein assembly factor BamE (lipoprotein component of BamABCDE complex)
MNNTIRVATAGIAAALAIGLAACSTTLGRNFDETYAKQIKPGETTKTEILGKLGRPPLRRGTPEEEVWTYAFYEGGGFKNWFGHTADEYQAGLGKQIRLVVTFKGDVVRVSSFTQEIPVPSNLPELK